MLGVNKLLNPVNLVNILVELAYLKPNAYNVVIHLFLDKINLVNVKLIHLI